MIAANSRSSRRAGPRFLPHLSLIHIFGNVEAHDERIVEQLVDVIDDLVGLALERHDAGNVLTVSRAKMGGAGDADICQLAEQARKAIVVRDTK